VDLILVAEEVELPKMTSVEPALEAEQERSWLRKPVAAKDDE
jgi:hypothetical protein